MTELQSTVCPRCGRRGLAAVELPLCPGRPSERDQDGRIVGAVGHKQLEPTVDPTPIPAEARRILRNLNQADFNASTVRAVWAFHNSAARLSREWVIEQAGLREILVPFGWIGSDLAIPERPMAGSTATSSAPRGVGR